MNDAPKIFRLFVPVSDHEAGIRFYQQLLGIEGVPIHGGRRYFHCGPVILAVIENSSPPIADHIYFATPDLDAVFERAKQLGCLEQNAVHGGPAGEIAERPWAERSFYARDPFGNGLCFVDDQTLFTGMT